MKALSAFGAAVLLLLTNPSAFAAADKAASQDTTTPASASDARLAPVEYVGGMPPVMDDSVYGHVLLEQFEDRTNGRDHQFRYDGQGWIGTDENKLWIKSEGLVGRDRRFTDGQHEFLYDRAISTYFDVQSGVRVDLDAGKTRTWGAFGVQGLAMYFFDVEATAYLSDEGHAAARVKGSYDLLITNRLILQPEVEANFYTKSDPGRSTGSGLSDIDAGLRLRYEFTRKIAPYIGVSYNGAFGHAQSFARQQGDQAQDLRFVFGFRTWF